MTDDLIEALAGPPPKDKRKTCYYAEWIKQQDPERKVAIEAALVNSKWKSTDLFKLLSERGYDKQYNTLRAHRVGTCSCDE